MKMSITDLLDEKVCWNILYVIAAFGLKMMSSTFFFLGLFVLFCAVALWWIDCYGVQMDGIIESHRVDSGDSGNLQYFIQIQQPRTSLEPTVAHNVTTEGTTITNVKNINKNYFEEVTQEMYEDAVKTGQIKIIAFPSYLDWWIPLEFRTGFNITPLTIFCGGLFLMAVVKPLLWLSFFVLTPVPDGVILVNRCQVFMGGMGFVLLLKDYWRYFTLLSIIAAPILKEPLCGPSVNPEMGFKTNLFLKLLIVLLSPLLLVCWIHRKWKSCTTQTSSDQPVNVAAGNGTSPMSVISMSNETTTTVSIL